MQYFYSDNQTSLYSLAGIARIPQLLNFVSMLALINFCCSHNIHVRCSTCFAESIMLLRA